MSPTHSVLLIEDDRRLAAEIEAALREEGIAASVADSVDQAIQLLETKSWALVLLDLVLRDGQDGFEILELLGTREPQVPVIVMTQHVRKYVTELAKCYASVSVIISKPCAASQIAAHVIAALHAT